MEEITNEKVNDSTSGEKTPDKVLILHYIDKSHVSLIETGKAINRVVIILILTSFIIIFLSSGIVSANNEFSVSGLKFNISSWLFLFGGSWVIGVLVTYFAGLYFYQKDLLVEILQLYKSIGYLEKREQLWDSPLKFPNILSIINNPYSNRANKLLIGLMSFITFLFPLAAEIVAFISMIKVFGIGGLWYLLLSFIFLILITFGYLITLCYWTIIKPLLEWFPFKAFLQIFRALRW